MYVIIGADKPLRGADAARLPVVQLLRRLRFTDATLEVVHVIPPSAYSIYASPLGAEAATDDLVRCERTESDALVRRIAQALAGTTREPARTSVLSGPVTERMLEHADAVGTDVMAVNAPHESPLGAALAGSIARSLVIHARQSVLVSRMVSASPTQRDGLTRPLRAVLATDHSLYAGRCIEKLLRFAPQGIAHLTVLTAYPGGELSALAPYLTNLALDPAIAVRESLTARNTSVLERLSPLLEPLGATCESRVVDAPVNDAITTAMEETGADLLIVGAQGHGFWDRVALGSVSFHQVMTAPYSVLVLRA